MTNQNQERVGVYVCHCGTNIAGVVDVVDVANWAAEKLHHQGVIIAREYKFMCSSLGQELIEKDIRPSHILTRKAFENALTVAWALGGSTNAVLHLVAMAHSAGVKLTIDDFTKIGKREA